MLERLEDWIAATGAERAKAVEQALQRIEQLDPLLHAWVQVLPQPQVCDGPLSGIPFGVKDVIETRNLVTEYGSPLYKGRHGPADAAIVRQMQQAGAILLGKTEAAAFAYRTPPATRNPRNPDHTPGGSSSGSAAAVAAGMVPIAIGTQTHGSILRPASYCGVTGFKPTYDRLSVDGVLPVARSLDTLGFFTHTPAGMLLLWEALGYSSGRDEDYTFGIVEPIADLEPPMLRRFGDVSRLLRGGGLDVRPLAIASLLEQLTEASRVVEQHEGARAHQARFQLHGDRLLDLADLVRAGLQIGDDRYRAALACLARGREQIEDLYRSTPVILVPAATGPAPKGLTTTGDARMNSPWTALGTPAISIPMPAGPGLPLGLQLTAAAGEDARVLRAAQRVAAAFEVARRTPHGQVVS